MGWWYAVLKPGNTAPRIFRARSEADAESRAEKAESDGCVAKCYHTATDNIHRAVEQIRMDMREDFSHPVSSGNILRGKR